MTTATRHTPKAVLMGATRGIVQMRKEDPWLGFGSESVARAESNWKKER